MLTMLEIAGNFIFENAGLSSGNAMTIPRWRTGSNYWMASAAGRRAGYSDLRSRSEWLKQFENVFRTRI